MAKKLLFFQILLLLLFTPNSIFGQGCPAQISVSATPGTTICEGEAIEFTAEPTGGSNLSYQWKINGNNYKNGRNITIPDLKDKDFVTVEITSSDTPTCTKTSQKIPITVNLPKTGTARIQANNTQLCPDETVIFSINSITNAGSGATFKWLLTRNGSTSIISSSNTLSDNIFQKGDKIQLFVDPDAPCVDPFYSNIIEIHERADAPAQPSALSGAISVCPGTPEIYSVTKVAGATGYIWTLPTGWTGSSSSNEITVTPGKESGTLSVRAKNDCGTSPEQTLEISTRTGIPVTSNTITGPTEMCPGTPVTFSVPGVNGASEYIWTLPNGWSGSGTSNSISVTPGSSGKARIEVQAKSRCGTSATSILEVLVRPGIPAAPASISGPAKVCPGSTATYSVSEVEGAGEYAWTLPSGWSGTSTSESITVTTGSSGGNILVKAINDCGQGTEQSLPVTVTSEAPVNPGNISGGTTVCSGETLVYSIENIPGASSYNWSIPAGWSISTENDNQITVIAGEAGENGNLSVTAQNGCGISQQSSLSVTVAASAPAVPKSIQGPAIVCGSQSGIAYSIDPVKGAVSYNWKFPQGWTITSGKGTASVIVDASSTEGNISVSAKNNCGESSKKETEIQVTSTEPAQPEAISSSLGSDWSVCFPSSGITFSVPEVSGAIGYNWIIPEGWEINSGNNTNTVTVTISEPPQYPSAAFVEVAAFNACGKSIYRISENVLCDGNSLDLPNGKLNIIYINNTRKIIIDNPQFINIDSIYIYNMLGQQVHLYADIPAEEKIERLVKSFTPGTYLVRIHSGNKILTKQIMLD